MCFSISRCKVIAWTCNDSHIVLVALCVDGKKKQEGNYKETVSFLF